MCSVASVVVSMIMATPKNNSVGTMELKLFYFKYHNEGSEL